MWCYSFNPLLALYIVVAYFNAPNVSSHRHLTRPLPPHRLPSLGLDFSAVDLDTEDSPPTPRSARSRKRSTVPSLRPQPSTRPTATRLTPYTRSPMLLNAIRHRQILASLLAHLSWQAYWSLCSTSRDFRDLFLFADLRNAILSRFVPGYSACLRISDPIRLQHVPVTLDDLNLLAISQSVPLHRYPMHALTCISRLVPGIDPEESARTLRLATLTQTHSRFVLLLQALAHSSVLPPPPEKEYADWRPPLIKPQLRQLNFPAPLSHTPSSISPAPLSARGRKSAESAPDNRSEQTLQRSRSRRLSLFGTFKAPPPPVEEPSSLKHYNMGWRHSLFRATGSVSDDEWGRKKTVSRPHRRFASATVSSESSTSSSSPSPQSEYRDSTLDIPSPPQRGVSLHDLSLATSRIRAPILRVYVPCSNMDLSDDSDSIALCEDQLYDSGLWAHLSTGDIVCNLGYVPPHTDDRTSSDGSLESRLGSEHSRQNRGKWLIFNGDSLVPFSPPDSLPLRSVFILPSPRYYTHIMSPHHDPVFTFRCFPPCDDVPQFTLGSLLTTVRSPHSPTGYAQVKKPMWTARVYKQIAQDEEAGLGWQGEWVLEGEGTREGQRVLLDCLRGVRGPLRQWQLPSRKELRKQERAGAKQRKAEFFSASLHSNSKRVAEEEHAESPQRKKVRLSNSETASKPVPSAQVDSQPTKRIAGDSSRAKPVNAEQPNSKPAEPKPKPKQSALEKLATRVDPTPAFAGPRSRQEKEEDAYIAYLEGKLGYAGRKNKKREDDGLDGLPEESQDSDLGEEDQSVVDMNEDEDEDEWHGIEVKDSESGSGSDSDDQEDQEEDPSDVPAVVPVANPQPGTAYVPPHLRNRATDEESEIIAKLTRQLKGLLNRMTEQNISSILDAVEEIYRKHRRNDVTSTLTTLIVDGISSHSSLLDSYVVLYGAFVSSLHKIIGIEFAAHFVQTVVSAYERHYADIPSTAPADVAAVTNNAQNETPVVGKECSNLIVLLSELYNFQVISCVLVYDVIRGLLDTDLSEFRIELLLKVVRNSGQQLRQDDPSALRDIIQIVQSKISDQDEALSSRTRFMVETLTNLKNNKLKRNVTQNQGGDAVERMKKFLTGLGKTRHVMAHEPLRVSLEDLHSAETKGKWWLVGAAWGGDPLIDRQEGAPRQAEPQNNENTALLKLARKQGMNTDIRRSIFVVLMSSDDYVDACERLSQLNLTELQQREIVRVLLHCCGNEKSYNPYYTLVCQHLCRSSHAYKITLQFCLWDFLRDLGETNVGGAEVIKSLKDEGGFDIKTVSSTRLTNVAKAYAWWIAKDCVALGILKPVDFTDLKSQSREFLRELMVQIFVSSQVSTPAVSVAAANGTGIPTTRNRGSVEEIFIKASRIEALAMGLVYFLAEALRNIKEMPDNVQTLVKWASSVAQETLRTGVDVAPAL
ncbi:MIF4G/MA4-domain-containing protein [Favolaschia claudopus]|uniref:MIF4G/MA4-domain-containing protein n=1 Tax=Favolaschia claudopus TaxID=2862362 RepID=A0AAW0C283_9AGAR